MAARRRPPSTLSHRRTTNPTAPQSSRRGHRDHSTARQGLGVSCGDLPVFLWQPRPAGSSPQQQQRLAPSPIPHWGRGSPPKTAAIQASFEEAERLGLRAATRRWSMLILGYDRQRPAVPNRWQPCSSISGACGARAGLPASRSPCQREAHKRQRWQPPAQIGSPAHWPIPERPSPAAGVAAAHSSMDHGVLLGQGPPLAYPPPNWRRAVDTDAITSAASRAGGIGPGDEQNLAGRWLVCAGPLACFPSREARPAIACIRILEGGYQLPAAIQATKPAGGAIELQRAGIGLSTTESFLSFSNQLASHSCGRCPRRFPALGCR